MPSKPNSNLMNNPRSTTKGTKFPEYPGIGFFPSSQMQEEEEESNSSSDKDNSEENEIDELEDHEEHEGPEDEAGNEEPDEQQLEDDMMEPPKLAPRKRKQGVKQAKMAKKQKMITPNHDKESEDVPTYKITYTLSIFSAAELLKAPTRREPKSRLLPLENNMPWIDFRSQLKIQFSNTLFPNKPTIADDAFEITYSIPRLVPNPLPLESATDYAHLITNISTLKKNPGAKIFLKEIHQNPAINKENEAGALLENATKKKKNKSRAPRESDILPGNVALNDMIQRLRERWQCNITNCHSDFCFIPSDGPHFMLGHEHLEKWGAAILRGETFATLEKPPNITLFDSVSTRTLATKSPILQARLNAMAKEKEVPVALAPAQPIVHVHFPPNAYPGAAGLPIVAPAGAPAALALPGPTLPAALSAQLIPPGLSPGPRMDMTTFCQVYNLAGSILSRLRENACSGTHAFPYMTGDELIALGFKAGELIDLKEAISEWATSGN